jgi:uncharacterized protein with PQ loop repeat
MAADSGELGLWDPAHPAGVHRTSRARIARRAMETADIVGWAAVAVLFATMTGQAWKEWRDRVKHGLSRWFFVGQVTASVLFIAYSAMVGSTIFVVGNSLVLFAALAGGAILAYNRKHR